MLFLVALVTGALSAFAFQPTNLWPLMPLAFAVLCELTRRSKSIRQSLLVGWGFGVGQFSVGLNWIQFAFTFQDKMPHWLGYLAVVLLSLYLAAYPAMATGLAWRFGRDRPEAAVLTLAGAWAITEWLRATMFTGFAWNPAGVVLNDTPWIRTAPYLGTYSLSLLVVLAGGGLWLLYRRRWQAGASIAALLGLLLLLPPVQLPGPCCLRTFDASGKAPMPPAPPPPPLARQIPPPQRMPEPWFTSIRVVQPNIGQEDKWREGFADEAARRLALLSSRPGGQRPRLLFWPEAAVTEPLEDQRSSDQRTFAEFERSRAASLVGPGEYLLTGGIAIFSRDGLRISGAANSVYVLGPGGKMLGRYDKAHLVPYGEYLPMRPLLSAIGLSRLAPGDIDFNPGPGPRTIHVPGWGKIGFQLCYEIIFSGEVVDRRDRPDVIFNPSNDAWFGRWGPPQHLAQARLRAAEEGIPVIRSTPTGISAVIDARGRIVRALPWHSAGIIDAQLPQPALSPTPFARFGNIIPLLIGFMLLIGGIVLGRTRR